jgi:hypothetical protein
VIFQRSQTAISASTSQGWPKVMHRQARADRIVAIAHAAGAGIVDERVRVEPVGQGLGRHAERAAVDVDEHRLRAAIRDRVDGADEGERLRDHAVAALHARKQQRDVQRGRCR